MHITRVSKKQINDGRDSLKLPLLIYMVLLFTFFTYQTHAQSTEIDTSTSGNSLRYPIRNKNSYPFSNTVEQSPLLLRQPSNIDQRIEYDPETGRYVFSEKVGELDYRPPSSVSLDDYRQYEASKSQRDYWSEKSQGESGAGPAFMKNLRLGNQTLDKVFGSDVISITPSGSAELIFGYRISKNDNPQLPVKNRKTGSFDFKEKIMMSVTGNIGDKMEVGLSYNTEASFDFENKTKLAYSGKEDEIIKKIEAGDITFNLPGSLITGSQSLFGLKTELQFGHLTVTSVLSHQKGESSSINVKGGAQQTEFEIDADAYDANRHFFLGHFFRDHYNEWLKSLPYIESQVQIQQIEVWVVNKQSDFKEARNILAFMDLGESYGSDGTRHFNASPELIRPNSYHFNYIYPNDNERNQLYNDMASNSRIREFANIDAAISEYKGNYVFAPGIDYVNMESARPLSEREYSLNRELGYISLNSPLRNDEILAVAYTYTYKGETFRVGELSNQETETLIVKLLKGITPSPKFPNWDLMMKNVYSMGAFQVSQEDFVLNILYRNDRTGMPVNYLSERDTITISSQVNEQILLKVLKLDNLDSRNEPGSDGIFDFIEGVTINTRNGKIYFPLLEPFGSDLRKLITNNDSDNTQRNKTADKYVFEELYDSTQTKAKQIAEKNKFLLKGHYQSASGSDISLNASNVPKGSVKVSSGSKLLTEGSDYTVDYTLGRVKIINQGLLESDADIKISLESNSLFNIQTKTLLGTHFDYRFSENFNVGATIMNLTERPLTKKVNMGEEPISNTIWGLNTSYRTQSQFLTTLVDKIPFIESKEPSSIAVDAEFAQLIPGQSKAIGKNGVAYIDDFEAAQSKIELKSVVNWTLASTPKGQSIIINGDSTSINSGFGRAKLAWYTIDPLFYGKSSLVPDNISENDTKGNYVREVEEQEIFPSKEEDITGQNNLSILNVAYYPSERGPYNFDTLLLDSAKLPFPQKRWGGMMRDISTSDFETSNIEFMEFWVLSPFLENGNVSGGDLYFQLGEISEDVLRDSRKSFENGYPVNTEDVSRLDNTIWGRVPQDQSVNDGFVSNNEAERANQDIGLDGLNDNDENSFHSNYIASLSNDIKPFVQNDPSADDFEYFLSDNHDNNNHKILDRYKNFNGLEGNSPYNTSTTQNSQSSRQTPDIEDINDDNTLNTTETYFQYKVSMRPNDLTDVGKNFIVDKVERTINGQRAIWYQFRIPLSSWEDKEGQIEDFKSVRFMRMVLAGFSEPVVLRFASIDLVRAEWRRYNYDMSETTSNTNREEEDPEFEVSAVNIEENSEKIPVNYVLPPGIDRVIDPSQAALRQLNEQSILLKVKDLPDGDGRAVFKNTQLDLRQYKNLKMFVHAEEIQGDRPLEDYEVTAFIRIGSDYQNNYYEYEVPLIVSPPGRYEDGDTAVWPIKNTITIALDELVNLKKERNDAMGKDLGVSAQSVYIKRNGLATVKVKGNPNLSNIRQIMLGVRNPNDNSSLILNDGQAKSAEVWFNELRVEDFNNKGGWAANGRVQSQLSDFGVINVAGSTSKPGFGGIEETVDERSKEETNQYDISSNLELGKFFPEKAKVSIPLYVGLSKTMINPEYYPKDPDIKFKDVLNAADTKSEKDSIKEISQDYTSRKSINLTNVRWNKQLEKVKVLSPGNLSGGVAYSYTDQHSYNVEYNNVRKYGANLNYVFNARPKNIQPLQKSKAFKKPAYRIIRDFNFDPFPSRFTFGTVLDRNYQEMKMRDISDDVILRIDSTVSKDFIWDRKYDIKWDLTRSLKLDYSATNISRIEEPDGAYDIFEPNNEKWKNEVWSNLLKGPNMSYSQAFNANYTIPINKIPIFNWVSANASYGSTYGWVRGEILPDPNRKLGNTLKNSNTVKLNGNLNLRGLYTKSTYFKRLDTPEQKGNKKPGNEDARTKSVQYEKKTFFKKDVPKNFIHKLKTEDVEIKVFDADGKEIPVQTAIVNENKVAITASDDILGANVVITGKTTLGKSPFIVVAETSLKLLTGFKSANLTWSRTLGTLLPGYLPGTDYLGLSNESAFKQAPGIPFAFGWQDYNMPYSAIDNKWLTRDSTFSKPVVFTRSDNFSVRASYEPFKGLRIDLTANRTYSESLEQLYFVPDNSNSSRVNYNNGYFVDDRYRGGNFSISIISIRTTFEKVKEKNGWESEAFNKLKANRMTISARRYSELAANNPNFTQSITHPFDSVNLFAGFGPTSQDVLIPAFLSAYTGEDPNKVTFEQFFWKMMPNWRITYDGLSRVAFFKQYFKTITFNHSYKSTYTIGSFGTNVSYLNPIASEYEGNSRTPLAVNNQGNIISEFDITGVSIKEDLSPLIGVDMSWNNSLLTRFEIGRTRMVALSINSSQVNETRNNDLTIGAGYSFKEVPFSITAGGNRKQIKSDLNVRIDFTIRDNMTFIRYLAETIDEEGKPADLTTGSKKFNVSFTADYVVSEKFNIQFYYNYTRNSPYTSVSFLNAETNIGFSLRLSL